jgi:hypothetical protein
MIRKRPSPTALNVVIHLGRSLFEGSQLQDIQNILGSCASEWTNQARIYRSRQDQQPIDLKTSGTLEAAIREWENQRRGVREALEKELGPPRFPRLLGTVELRGADASLTVVISADEFVFAPFLDGRWIFGNRIALQIRKSKVEGVDAAMWSAGVIAALCENLSPFHGDVHTVDEFDAKNMSHAGGGLAAIGVDVFKYLSGLYWMNFFGKPYCDLMGRDTLLTAPAADVRAVNDGVLLRLTDNPRDWATEAYKTIERRVLEHIGPQYFFSRDDPNRKTVAPNFQIRT